MTTIVLDRLGIDAYELGTRIAAACHVALGRTPEVRPTSQPDGSHLCSLIFDPDLSPAEIVTADAIIAAARGAVSLTPLEREAIRPSLQVKRDLRQMGRNAFTAQTTAQQLRQLYDSDVATTVILIAVFRDE